MQITANNSYNITTNPVETPPAKPVATFPEQPSKDNVALSRVSSLLNTLQTDPNIRPEVVERGRMLAMNPNYPQAEVISKLAGLVVSSGAAS